jgi:hypothetical protein
MRETLKGHRFVSSEEYIGKERACIKVGAKKQGPKFTLLECRLPVKEIVSQLRQGIAFHPYEVATVYRDSVIGKQGIWRAQIVIGCTKKSEVGMGVWMVTVRDEAAKMELVTATIKEVEEVHGGLRLKNQPQDPDEVFPLDRVPSRMLKQPAGRLNVWDRLRLIEYDPLTGSLDE